MRDLIRAALSELRSRGGDFESDYKQTAAFEKCAKHIEKNFADYSISPSIDLDFSFFIETLGLNFLSERWKVDLKSDENFETLVGRVYDWWASVPRTYRFTFPIPNVAEALQQAAPVDIGAGITIVGSQVLDPDDDSQEHANMLAKGSKLGDLLAPKKKATLTDPYLVVECRGFVLRRTWLEPAAAEALRTCKVLIMLGEVLDVFDRSILREDVVAKTTYVDLLSDAEDTLELPRDFGAALVKVSLASGALKISQGIGQPQRVRNIAEIQTFLRVKLQKVATVIEGARAIAAQKKSGGETQADNDASEDNAHCGRIVTAAEWLFDASYESAPAMAYVQLAIGFEALFGNALNSVKGVDKEPLVQTLANKLAFSVGTSAAERKSIHKEFSDFYVARSKIVHNGALRLLPNEKKLYDWGERVLRRALAKELGLVKPVNLENYFATFKLP